MPDHIKGRYFAPGGSKSVEAELRDGGDGLLVTTRPDGKEIKLVFSEVGDRLANLPRKIYFTDGSVFETENNDAVDAAFGKSKHFASRLTRLEASWKIAVIAVVASAFLVFGIYRWGIPVMATLASWATPASVVSLIDDGALETVDDLFLEPSSMPQEDRTKYTAIFEELVLAAEESPEKFRLEFRDGGRIGANALALPGGTIILTDQLAALAENEDEVAGVLAHEIGHVTEQHSLRQIYRALGIGFMAAVIIGDTSQILDDVVAQAAVLDTLTYSREFETHADQESVKLMVATGRDPLAFISLIERIFEDAGIESKQSGWLSTHPGNEKRRRDAEAMVEQLRE